MPPAARAANLWLEGSRSSSAPSSGPDAELVLGGDAASADIAPAGGSARGGGDARRSTPFASSAVQALRGGSWGSVEGSEGWSLASREPDQGPGLDARSCARGRPDERRVNFSEDA